MEGSAMKPRLWQWYAYSCSGDVFQIVGYDPLSGRIGLKSFNGELRSIHENVWSALALELRDPPEDMADPVYEARDASRGCPEHDRHSQGQIRYLPESAS